MISCAVVALPFILWDGLFTHLGVWGFNEQYLTGISIGNLPMEEVLFFFCIPYACVFTYFVLRALWPRDPFHDQRRLVLLFVGVVALVFIIKGHDKLYTCTTGTITFLLVVYLYYRESDISYIFISYLCILPFFIISNGLLTGSCLDAPIVWYDSGENLGFRIFTIPIEDAMYGLLLIMFNILAFEWVDTRLHTL